MTLKVHNTLTKEKEEFVPIDGGRRVGMYVCGPTVYDDSHVGHARSYVAFDVIRRYLEYKGYLVTYVQNFTDVDDRIIQRSQEKDIPPLELSKHYTKSYIEDMEKLNIKPATYYPFASQLIPEMIETVEKLLEKEHAYVAGDGSVYFSVESAKDIFGQLTHQKLEDMLDGARVEVDETKRNPKDFALWKAAKKGEISWESPWGPGRPGWHIECSTMANTYIGSTLDIHGGGMDLIFPHHESEILQSESIHGGPFARYWLHNGFININSEKMSKSLGNFFTIKEILNDFDPMVVRFFLLYTHYRREIDFSKDALEEAGRAYQRLATFRRKLAEFLAERESTEPMPDADEQDIVAQDEQKKIERFKQAFMEHMDDDFNTRGAVSVLFGMVSEGNRFLDRTMSHDSLGPVGVAQGYAAVFDELTDILGLLLLQNDEEASADQELLDAVVQVLFDLRQKAREKKEWDMADEIRDRLKELGITIEDKGKESVWRLG